MKSLWKNGIVIILLVGGLYVIFLRECNKTNCPANDQVLVSKSVWDSILVLADKPPIIKIDTVYKKGTLVYVDKPLPIPIVDKNDSTINHYSDSLVNKEIDVRVDFKTQGKLLDLKWRYSPIITEIVKNTTVFVPKIVDRPVPVSKGGLYVSGILGGNANSFLPGAGLDWITKKGTVIGGIYQRYGKENIYSFKLGIPIRLKKK